MLEHALILTHWGLLGRDNGCSPHSWVHDYDACTRAHHPHAAGSLPCYNPVKVSA